MLYEPATDKTTMIRPLTVENFKKNPKIKSIRCKLIILISIQLALLTICLLSQMVGTDSIDGISNKNIKAISTANGAAAVDILSAVITLIYFVIYIILVIKYKRTAILVFAWLNLILITLGFIGNIPGIIRLFSTNAKIETRFVVTFIIASAISLILAIFTTVFSFQLAKSMKIPEDHQIV